MNVNISGRKYKLFFVLYLITSTQKISHTHRKCIYYQFPIPFDHIKRNRKSRIWPIGHFNRNRIFVLGNNGLSSDLLPHTKGASIVVVQYLCSICPVVIQLLFSLSLDNNWRTIEGKPHLRHT